jgi:hypothetical protein
MSMESSARLITENGNISTNPRLIRQRFLALNKDRLKLARNALKKRQRIFVDLLPVLFHLNDENLPGFISNKVPSGIADFTITKRMITDAARLNVNFEYERRAMRVYNIQALYMIGSSGTNGNSSSFSLSITSNGHGFPAPISATTGQNPPIRNRPRTPKLTREDADQDPSG